MAQKKKTIVYKNVFVVNGVYDDNLVFNDINDAITMVDEEGLDISDVEIREYQCIKVHQLKLVTETKEVLKVIEK